MTGHVIYEWENCYVQSQRLLACLQLLQGERRLTARSLARELAVSMRTVYRDVEALSAAGVPIHMERGPQGGIVLADGYRRALAQFTGDELQSLFAAGSGPMADLGIASHRAALSKLAGALPAQQRQAATSARERLLLDHNRWGRGEQPTALLTEIRRAVELQRSLRLEYRDRSGAISDRVVDPLGLVAKAGVWYLVARDCEKGYRTFRAQRIIAAEILPQRFVRPADFHLERYWDSSVASIERPPDAPYVVVVRIRPHACESLRLYWRSTVIAEDSAATTLSVAFVTREAAAAELLAFDHVLDIVSPAEIVTAVVERAEAVVRKYGAARV
jgi:predicted DNA-binding transcriptional regulator YafY